MQSQAIEALDLMSQGWERILRPQMSTRNDDYLPLSGSRPSHH